MYVVGFNGPPESGKDTVAAMLAAHMEPQGVTIPVKEESLSMPLRKIAYAMVDWTGDLEGLNYETFKRTTFPTLNATGRELMIAASENFLKVGWGKEVMAKLLIERNRSFEGLLLIRDAGFQCEVDPLIREYGIDNAYIVNVMRPGKTFEGDSREWVSHHNSKCQIAIDNGLDLHHLRTEAGRVYGRLVNQMGWIL